MCVCVKEHYAYRLVYKLLEYEDEDGWLTSHILHSGTIRGAIIESNSISNLLSECGTPLVTDSLGYRDGSDASRLSDSNALIALQEIGIIEKELRYLRGLPTTCLPNHDHDLMVADCGEYLISIVHHRQYLIVALDRLVSSAMRLRKQQQMVPLID